MAATTLCCMVLVLPTVLEARKPSRRTARIRRERREVLIYADNRTANKALFIPVNLYPSGDPRNR